MVKQMKPVFQTTKLQHQFSDDEKVKISRSCSSAVQAKNALEEDKKQIVSEFKSKITMEEVEA